MLPVLPEEPRVAFALSEREQRLFFPAGTNVSLPEANVLWLPNAPLPKDDAWLKELEQRQPHVIVTGWATPPIPVSWIEERASNLPYLCHVAGSVRRVLPRRFLELGGIASNWGSIAAPFVAEHAILLALAALRHIHQWRPFIAERRMGQPVAALPVRTLLGRRVGIHGFGRIAQALLGLLKPFGVIASVYAEGVPADIILQSGATPAPSLHSLFSGSEVLFECEALRADTEKSVTAEHLAALPDGAIFVNIGRGRLIDEVALEQEAQRDRIQIAIDVMAQEPVHQSSPLFKYPNVIISPHIGGPTTDGYPVCGAYALENIRRWLNK